jgi:5S rRNA maturation endonuclease (ribonuclease M5)
MGTSISAEQIERLLWIRNRVQFPRIMLFLDRDRAGQQAASKIQKQLERHKLSVTVFDWHQKPFFNGQSPGSIQDPADMTVSQLQALRSRGII